MRSFQTRRFGARVVFAAGARARVAAELTDAGAARVLVVASERLRDLADDLSAELGEVAVGRFDEVVPQVPREVADRARARAREAGADWILALGGGSAIGIAKAVALDTGARIAAVPTTLSGSEMTPIYGITAGDAKQTGRDVRARPGLVVYDPDLVASLSDSACAASALNAAAHAVEALYAADLGISAARAAEESLAGVAANLPRLAADPAGARAELLYAAHLAGHALGDATMGLHHKLCHVLGARFRLPHAQVHACLLPHTLDANLAAAPRAAVAIARGLGSADPAGALHDLARAAGVELNLSSLGFDPQRIAEVASLATEAPYPNPRPIDAAIVTEVLSAAVAGERPAARHIAVPRPMTGFGASLSSEARDGALPRRQNSPRPAPLGLYAEQVSGTPFTTRRSEGARVWLYRLRPSVCTSSYQPFEQPRLCGRFGDLPPDPNLERWAPRPYPEVATDFVAALETIAGRGEAGVPGGIAIHSFAATADMHRRCMYNGDGELLVVVEQGALDCITELGPLRADAGHALIVPRGLKFSMNLPMGAARGMVCEVFGRRFRLPERGPIGANGLADERHFRAPSAAFEDVAGEHEIIAKLGGRLYRATMDHSPFDVVAWHGQLVPFVYDLADFCPVGAVAFDHPDPSIFTLLTAPLDEHGAAVADFVVFRGRWEVAEHTFRPPYYHRNAASELNYVLHTTEGRHGFESGAYFHTPIMTPHGINTESVIEHLREGASEVPYRSSDDSLWVMFESALPLSITPWALQDDHRDAAYRDLFPPPPRPKPGL